MAFILRALALFVSVLAVEHVADGSFDLEQWIGVTAILITYSIVVEIFSE